jgi:ABC-type multidrug transport system permease subunit
MYSLPAIGHFIDDRLAFQQEHRRGLYTTPSYFLATQLAELPALCSVTLCLSVTLYSLCGLYPGRLGMFLAIAWLVLAVGFAACQLIAAALSRGTTALAVYLCVLAFSYFFCGIFVSVAEVSAGWQWLFRTSFCFYATEALANSELELRPNGPAYLRALGFDTGAGVVERDVGALAAIFLVTRLLTLAVLHARRGQRR